MATAVGSKFYTIPAGTRASKCKGRAMGGTCEVVVYWIDDGGAWRIVDADVEGGRRPSESKDEGQFDAFSATAAPVHPGRGWDHHATCPDVELFRRRRP